MGRRSAINLLNSIKNWIYRHKLLTLLGLGVLLAWWFCLPKTLFKEPVSTVVVSSNGQLLGARIADDGQWRFPELDSVPKRFQQCIVLFEDAHFYQHPGFNPASMAKALWHNITHGNRRGGSTLTQQVIRLARGNRKRTYFEKLIELFKATRLEFRYSKEKILDLYASHAPFGGNVVGLSAASWRYFGMPPEQLSWGQTAALAVLPNAPSLIFPGTHDKVLKTKRDRLLLKLKETGILDQTSYELALEEPLPAKPLTLPDLAPHLTELLRKKGGKHLWKSSIDLHLQRRANALAAIHYGLLKQNQIHNLAILVLDNQTKKVLAYVGNSPTDKDNNTFVDMVQSTRSTGSVLKPFLFAAAMDEGLILPNSLMHDVPTIINGYEPKNFDRTYQGAVPASTALARSLNIPAVRLLRSYGLDKFYELLPKLGITSVTKPASYYGLPLILGGAECNLWELTNAYAGLAQTTTFFEGNSSEYRLGAFAPASLLQETRKEENHLVSKPPVLGAGAIYNTLDALDRANRPTGEENWSFFSGAQPLAWKTGTSYGFKDAWAIGTTPEYTIGVWVGNADGEGRPGLTGITAAAPLLFDVLAEMPQSGWFRPPYDALTEARICTKSGHLAGPYCDETEMEWIVPKGLQSGSCPFHQPVTVDAEHHHRVDSNCYPIDQIQYVNWFSLPPVMEYYYAPLHPEYEPLPPYLSGCGDYGREPMAFLYPKRKETVLVPREFGGQLGKVVFKLAHQHPETEVFWYLNDTFLGSTKQFHELAVTPSPGDYLLTAMDALGNRIQEHISIQYAGAE